jgi:hypothetical protein
MAGETGFVSWLLKSAGEMIAGMRVHAFSMFLLYAYPDAQQEPG